MSCLFQSFAYFMIEQNPDQIRQEICDYLSTNPSLMDDLSLEQISELEGGDIKTYIAQMRKKNTWGGAIEIKAFCNLYEVDVEVIILSNGKKIMFHSNKQPAIGLVTISWNGFHYEPIKC